MAVVWQKRARFGGAAEDWLDLSTGINPEPWPGAEDIAVGWRDLPDPQDLRRLEEQAAAHFDVDPALCCAVPGSEAGLRLLARIIGLPGRHLPLSYSTHADAFAGLEGGPASAFVIANPNNPDGRVTPRGQLLDILDKQEADAGWLIVDEAFADCRKAWSIADRVAQDRRLIVLRSFGKFFGLAGVRLGFVIAPPDILMQLRHLLGEWPVCSAALTFGTAAYADGAWIAATRYALPRRMSRLDTILRWHGLMPKGECPLFRLVETERAHDLFAALARQHVLTRPFADNGHLLRFGLPGDDPALTRFDTALGKALAHG
jgi:cobalamin biosynthetic protein CobC